MTISSVGLPLDRAAARGCTAAVVDVPPACIPTTKYTATLGGVTIRLALPEPVTAYVDADGVRRITN